MKCPYNNFEECLGFECPAYMKRSSYERCSYASGLAEQPHKTTVVNNYYYNKEEQNN